MCSRGQCYRPAPLVAATVSASMRSPQQRTRRYAQSVGGTTPHPAEAVPSSHPPDSPHAVGEPAKQATTTESQDQYTSRRGHPTRPRARHSVKNSVGSCLQSVHLTCPISKAGCSTGRKANTTIGAPSCSFSSQTSQTAAPSPSAKHSNCDMSSISWSPTLSCFDGFDFSMGYHVQCETQSECPQHSGVFDKSTPLGTGLSHHLL